VKDLGVDMWCVVEVEHGLWTKEQSGAHPPVGKCERRAVDGGSVVNDDTVRVRGRRSRRWVGGGVDQGKSVAPVDCRTRGTDDLVVQALDMTQYGYCEDK
jgi:hypothetical protein